MTKHVSQNGQSVDCRLTGGEIQTLARDIATCDNGHDPDDRSGESYKAVIAFTKNAGLPLINRNTRWQWDGKRGSTRNNASNVLHDLAHWQVCSPMRRKMHDFGLGTGPDSMESAKLVLKPTIASREEAEASTLGIYYEFLLGFASRQTYLWHNWEQQAGITYVECLENIRRKGFINVHGKPTFLKRNWPDHPNHLKRKRKMKHNLKGRVFIDQHPDRRDRILAVTWEGSKRVVVYSSNGKTTRIRKNRLRDPARYSDTGVKIDPDSDFVREVFPTIKVQ